MANNPREKIINGERCASSELAEYIFVASSNSLREFCKQGMPYYKEGRFRYYPIERCHAWFRGEDSDVS